MSESSTNTSGRPTIWTPELQNSICEALKIGLYVEEACVIAGISKQTYYNWLERGKKEEEPYTGFLDAIEKAQACAEQDLLAAIKKDTSWQSKAWILERKFPKKWGRKMELKAEFDIHAETAREREDWIKTNGWDNKQGPEISGDTP